MVLDKTGADIRGGIEGLQADQSECVWLALRQLLNVYSNADLILVQRDDLVKAVDMRDLEAFRNEFDF
jgi:hypothetical protein